MLLCDTFRIKRKGYIVKLFLSLFFSLFFVNVFAQSIDSIDMQIAAIKKAEPQERVRLMNAFKRKLIKMNQEQRIATIQKMQKAIDAKKHMTNHTQNSLQHYEKNIHIDNTHDIHATQNMAQHQAAEQFHNVTNIKKPSIQQPHYEQNKGKF